MVREIHHAHIDNRQGWRVKEKSIILPQHYDEEASSLAFFSGGLDSISST
jgi:hypothetical protein